MTIVAICAILSGCGSSSPAGPTAAQYARSVCSAVAPWRAQIISLTAALAPNKVAKPAERKEEIQAFLARVTSATDQTLRKLKAAGTPQLKDGKAIEASWVDTFTRLKGAFARASHQAAKLPTNSRDSFLASTKQIGANISAVAASLHTLSSPDLQKAAAKIPTCAGITL